MNQAISIEESFMSEKSEFELQEPDFKTQF